MRRDTFIEGIVQRTTKGPTLNFRKFQCVLGLAPFYSSAVRPFHRSLLASCVPHFLLSLKTLPQTPSSPLSSFHYHSSSQDSLHVSYRVHSPTFLTSLEHKFIGSLSFLLRVFLVTIIVNHKHIQKYIQLYMCTYAYMRNIKKIIRNISY